MVCPLCGGNSIGKVGNNQFYCWDCFVEFALQKNKITIYEVGDDGSLLPYNRDKSQIIAGGN
ncbi:MAG TPA: hypothetical protein GXX35_08490 [Thermoanaerobacterales bacterium]|nr:hypothetical protein [Thermoanaerobacterales bacterium]